jgi:hypothetical protein
MWNVVLSAFCRCLHLVWADGRRVMRISSRRMVIPMYVTFDLPKAEVENQRGMVLTTRRIGTSTFAERISRLQSMPKNKEGMSTH